LNEIFFDAASNRERSEIIVFCYGTIPNALAARAEITPNIQVASPDEAIIGGIRGKWEDSVDTPANIWAGNKFLLGDFKNLAAYLAKSAVKDEELLKQAIASATAAPKPVT
jgi:hypothetical protein